MVVPMIHGDSDRDRGSGGRVYMLMVMVSWWCSVRGEVRLGRWGMREVRDSRLMFSSMFPSSLLSWRYVVVFSFRWPVSRRLSFAAACVRGLDGEPRQAAYCHC